MAIGALGIKNMVKSGGVLTIYITVPLTILESFLKDHSSIYSLAGNLASDLIKIGVPSAMGYIAGIIFGGFTAYAIVPIGVAIAITVYTGYKIDQIDKEYELTEKLSKLLEDMSNQISKSAKNTIYDAERGLYRGMREFIGSEGGYRGPF
jgi:hypothetical protein